MSHIGWSDPSPRPRPGYYKELFADTRPAWDPPAPVGPPTSTTLVKEAVRQDVPRAALWASIDHKRPAPKHPEAWHKTHGSLHAACEALGMQLIATEEERTTIPPRIDSYTDLADFDKKKVVVAMRGLVCYPASVRSVLKGRVGASQESVSDYLARL